MENKIKIAEKRIEEAQERAKYFQEKYAMTGDKLYKEMCEDEIERVTMLVEAIVKAKVKAAKA